MITYCVRFFPAAGLCRNTGIPGYRGQEGVYWSTAPHSEIYGWMVLARPNDLFLHQNGRTFGYSVRCVARRY